MTAFITSGGVVSVDTSFIHSTYCAIDLTDFPYDDQNCWILLKAANSESSILILEAGTFVVLTSDKNPQWDVNDLYGYTGESPTQLSSNSYNSSVLNVTVILHRLPNYYLQNIVSPMVFLNAVGLFTFFIPLKSGERVSVCISVVLGMTVFQIVIADILPQTSRTSQTPVIVLYAWMSFAALVGIILSTILTMNVSYRSGDVNWKVPRFVFFKVLASLVCLRQKGAQKMTVLKQQSGTPQVVSLCFNKVKLNSNVIIRKMTYEPMQITSIHACAFP